mmetsp:Transcript_106333/g.297668  ORF Transcript_106333/g.297668 Transcript_106333/m.297668 type:complete len:219 (-) Transcript_106333:376-1032(-)
MLGLEQLVLLDVILVHDSSPLVLVAVGALQVVDFAHQLRLRFGHSLDHALLLLQRLLQAVLRLFLPPDVVPDVPQGLVATLQGLLELEQLLLQALSATELSLGLCALRVQGVLDVGDLRGALDLLGLVLLHLLRQADVLLRQLAHLCVELVPRLLQVVPLGDQIVDGVLLGHAQARALLHEMAKVCDLQLQVVDRVLRALLLLVRGLDHLPRPLDLFL